MTIYSEKTYNKDKIKNIRKYYKSIKETPLKQKTTPIYYLRNNVQPNKKATSRININNSKGKEIGGKFNLYLNQNRQLAENKFYECLKRMRQSISDKYIKCNQIVFEYNSHSKLIYLYNTPSKFYIDKKDKNIEQNRNYSSKLNKNINSCLDKNNQNIYDGKKGNNQYFKNKIHNYNRKNSKNKIFYKRRIFSKEINKEEMYNTVKTSSNDYFSNVFQRIKNSENIKYLKNKLKISNIQFSIRNNITKKYFYINKVNSFSIIKNEKEKYKVLNKEISFAIICKPKKNYQKELVKILEILKKENKFYQEKDFINKGKLFEGGFTEIYSSFSIKDNQDVCLKKINLDKMENEYKQRGYPEDSYERDIKNEIELLNLFSDKKNSVKYYGNYNKIIEKAIIMEKCDDDLEKFLKKRGKSFSTDEIKNIFRDINEIFKIMHQKKIIHRDLKLTNFLVKFLDEEKSKFIVKLSDYGIGKFLNKANIFSGYKGTNEYMAPEMHFEKMKEYKNNHDIFSLGIILYQLAHNLNHPFKRKEDDQNFLFIYCNFYDKDNFVIEFDKSIKCKEYKDLIERMLKINPENRLNWEQYFEHPFFK